MTLIQSATPGEALKLAFQEVHHAQTKSSGLLNVDDIVHCVDTLCARLGCVMSDLPMSLCEIGMSAHQGMAVTPYQLIDALLDARGSFAA